MNYVIMPYPSSAFDNGNYAIMFLFAMPSMIQHEKKVNWHESIRAKKMFLIAVKLIFLAFTFFAFEAGFFF